MRIHVGAAADEIGALSAALLRFATLTEGIRATSVGSVSDAYRLPSGRVIAAFVVRTQMDPDALVGWLGEAATGSADALGHVEFDVLLAEDTEMEADGFMLPHPGIAPGAPVLRPLLDVDPDVRFPFGGPVADLGDVPRLDDLGQVPGFERPTEPEPRDTPAHDGPPDWDEAFSWADDDREWVPVTRGWGWHKDIELRLTLLLDAGIPACLHDRPFGELQAWFWGQVVPTAILVAPSRADDACALLAATFEDEDGMFATAALELDEQRERPSYRRLRLLAWFFLLFGYGPLLVFSPLAIGVILIVFLYVYL